MKIIQVHCIGVAAERDICKPRQIKLTFSFVFGNLDELTPNYAYAIHAGVKLHLMFAFCMGTVATVLSKKVNFYITLHCFSIVKSDDICHQMKIYIYFTRSLK